MPRGIIIQHNKTIMLGLKVIVDSEKERLININIVESIMTDLYR
jgi:hypothetical protein